MKDEGLETTSLKIEDGGLEIASDEDEDSRWVV